MQLRSVSLRSAGPLALALLVTACPSDPTSSDEPRAPRGAVRVGYPEEPVSLSPIDPPPPAADVLRALLPSFHVVGPDLRLRPSLLAAEPEIRVDGSRQEIRFRLRQARWSDGRPITVDDVAFTWRTMQEAGAEGFSSLREVIKDGPRRGRLVLDPPYAAWVELFSAGRFVLPAHTGIEPSDWVGGPPVSGGPFRIERWERGRSIILRRNARHAPSAQLERVVIEFVPDPTTAIQLFAAGELDVVAPMLGVSWGRRLARVRDAAVTRRSGPDLVHLLFNTDRVGIVERRQIADAFDRSRFAEVVLRDEGKRLDGIMAPEQPGSVPAWMGYGETPPERVTGEEELTLVYPEGELFEGLARALQAAVERVGGDIELVALDADVYRERYLSKREFDLTFWHTRAGTESRLGSWFRSNVRGNLAGLNDEPLDQMIEVAEGGGPQGSTALIRAQERLAERLPMLPIFQAVTTMAARGVKGPEANPTVDGPFWNVATWSVPA